MRLLPLLLVLPAVALAGSGCAWTIGHLVCEKEPAKAHHVEMRLMDRDSVWPFSYVDPDDAMGFTYSDDEGRFSLEGCADDQNWFPGVNNMPEPYVVIKHYCNTPAGEKIIMPEFNVFSPNTYDVGTISLDTVKSSPPPNRATKTHI